MDAPFGCNFNLLVLNPDHDKGKTESLRLTGIFAILHDI